MSGGSDNFACVAILGFESRAASAGPAPTPQPDASQRAVIDLGDGVSAAVIGAPGTGKTTTIIELVADRVINRGWSPDQLVVLTSNRASATRLRDALALRLAVGSGGVATNGPLARTVNSLAFEIAGAAAEAAGGPSLRLVTGGEQDSDIAALLDGHIEDATGPRWPEELRPEIRRLRAFRTELRELMMRATEFDVSPARLRELAVSVGRPEWAAAADFIDEYLAVVGFARPGQLDAAELAQFAAAAIRSEQAGERVVSLRAVIVDDLQEATESSLNILRALASRGIAIVAFGDPDVAANAFRGGEPNALGQLASVLGSADVRELTLSSVHRQGPALRAFTSSIVPRIGTAAAGRQRTAVAVGTDDAQPLALIEATSPARERAAIARILRARHLEDGVPWSSMAVIVRSGAQIEGLSRSLSVSEVPVRTLTGGTALRDEQAARALLDLVDLGVGRSELTPQTASDLLLGPFGGLDRLGLRRLRLALRAEEVAGGGTRTSDELLVDSLVAPGRLITIDHRVGRAAEKLANTLAALRDSDGSIEELLWIGWERGGLADSWREQALGGGITAAEANRNLDGVVALFTAAKRFSERRPDEPPTTFLANVLDSEVPEDTLSPQPSDDAVLITTPSGSVGLELDTVVVASLQDGAWPNLRLRDSLLGAQDLVRAVTGVDATAIDERKQVLADELRMFALAVSRARTRLVLSAVSNEDESPSMFLGLLPDSITPMTKTVEAMSLREATGRIRRILVSEGASEQLKDAAASTLADLVREGVSGAAPRDWHGLIPRSSGDPLYLVDEKVPVSPSSIERLTDSPLDWFLEMIAGGDSGTVANVGTILHWAMETSTDISADALWSAVESRWGELRFDAPWLGERQRRIARGLTDALGEYLADFSASGKSLVGAESRFELEVDRAVVRGSIDRVERNDAGEVVIVDLKTGAPVRNQDEADAHPQLQAYQLAYAEGVLDEPLDELGAHSGGGAKLLFVKEGKGGKLYREAVQAPLTPEQLQEFRDRISFAADLIARAEFEGRVEVSAFGKGDVARLRLNRVRAVSSD